MASCSFFHIQHFDERSGFLTCVALPFPPVLIGQYNTTTSTNTDRFIFIIWFCCIIYVIMDS